MTEPEAEPDGVHSAVGCETCKTVMTRMVKNGASSAILSTRVAACFKLARARAREADDDGDAKCHRGPGAESRGARWGSWPRCSPQAFTSFFGSQLLPYRWLIWAL